MASQDLNGSEFEDLLEETRKVYLSATPKQRLGIVEELVEALGGCKDDPVILNEVAKMRERVQAQAT